jgi:alginate O-acetyltransferase complex protein AlgI
MSAYLPSEPAIAALLGAILVGLLLAGFLIGRLPPGGLARGAAWALVVAGTVGAERLSANEPAGVRMLAIIGALLFAMKVVVTVEARGDGGPTLRAWQWFAFAAAWPGMRPNIFASAGGQPLSDAGALLGRGAVRLFAGVGLVGAAWGVAHGMALPPLAAVWLATPLLLVGLSLMLHFGAFNLLAGAWRLAGVDARPLFRAPLSSRSLAEFWGRRWNLAFSEMTALGVYRPLVGRLGKGPATAAAFLCSGLLHELAISVPVKAGFGLPLTYFALHGLLVLVERRLERAGRAVSGWGWGSHAWVIGWLALPLPILFHPPFLRGAVWPLIGMGPSE